MAEHTFKLFDSQIIVDQPLDNYVYIRKTYFSLADALRKKFIEYYKEYNSNMDDVANKVIDEGNAVITAEAKSSINLLVQFEIYDIDEETFLNKYYLKYCTWSDDCNRILDKYAAIVLDQQQQEEYRAARKEARGRFEGGGFGLTGAIKGATEAAALNMATGAAHSIFNAAANAVSSANAESKKDNLFKDPNTLSTFANDIYSNLAKMRWAIIDVLEERTNIAISTPSKSDSDKATAMLNNLERVPDKKSLLSEIIQLNPFNMRAYKAILASGLDKDGDIVAIAEYFGIDLSKEYKHAIHSFYEHAPKDNEKDALMTKKNLMNMMNLYHVTKSHDLDDLDKLLQKFDLEARSFNGYEYKTREDCKKAKLQDSLLEKTCNGINLDDRDTLINTKNKIMSKEWMGNVLDRHVKFIDDHIIAVEENQIKGIIGDIKSLSKPSCKDLITKISGLDYNADVKNKYTDMLNQRMNEIDELEASQLCGDIDSKSEAECNTLLNKIHNADFNQDTTNKYDQLLHNRINAIWSEEDAGSLDFIYLSVNPIDESSRVDACKRIEQVARTETDKANYTNAIKALTAQNIIEASLAVKFNNRSGLRNYIWEICAIIWFVANTQFSIFNFSIWVEAGCVIAVLYTFSRKSQKVDAANAALAALTSKSGAIHPAVQSMLSKHPSSTISNLVIFLVGGFTIGLSLGAMSVSVPLGGNPLKPFIGTFAIFIVGSLIDT